jgi:hypothetical protein
MPAGDEAKKPAPPARATITAELACLHCTFGQGDSCAVCLKIDDQTPILLAGKAAQQFEAQRLSQMVLVAEGTLSVNREKRLVLTSDKARPYTDKDKGQAPEKGQVRVVGGACCGHCDLKVCDVCTLAVVNAGFPLVLDGKLAQQHAEGVKAITATGRPFLDPKGLLRLDAKKVDLQR